MLKSKVGWLCGVKSAIKCTGYRWAPNLLKSVALAPGVAKVRRGLHPAPTGASAKRSSIHAASKVATLKSVPRADQSC